MGTSDGGFVVRPLGMDTLVLEIEITCHERTPARIRN